MDVTGERLVPFARDRVWTALNDPLLLAAAVPGCEALEEIEPGRFKATVRAAIGPVRARFAGELQLSGVQPPERYTLSGQASAGTAGFGRGSADVALVETDGGTAIRYVARAEIGGKLAQIGSRLIVAVVDKLTVEFFDNLERELKARFAPPGDPGAGAEPDPDPPLRRRLFGWINGKDPGAAGTSMVTP